MSHRKAFILSHSDAGQTDGIPKVQEIFDVPAVYPQEKEKGKNNYQHNGLARHVKPPGAGLEVRNFLYYIRIFENRGERKKILKEIY
jgi:hypothetical protein